MGRSHAMPITIGDGLSFCGHTLSQSELDLIRSITREFAGLTLTELAATLCELLEWRRPNGGLKSRECYLFLRELHDRGWLPWLPAPQPRHPRVSAPRPAVLPLAAPPALTGALESYRPISLQLIECPEQRLLFRRYLEQYHYLGYRAPYGAQLRYWARAANPDLPPLAALLFTSAAWRMAPRDGWIGWSDQVRQRNLPLVINRHPLSDSPLGTRSPSGQPYSGASRATTTARLAGPLWCHPCVDGNPGGPDALPRHLLSRRQLDRSRHDHRPRTHGPFRTGPRDPQADFSLSPTPPLSPTAMRRPTCFEELTCNHHCRFRKKLDRVPERTEVLRRKTR